MPKKAQRKDKETKAPYEAHFESIIIPKTGFSFGRPGHKFNPDAYSHGGISLQELMIPMVVMKVRDAGDGLLSVGEIEGTTDIHEGVEAQFTIAFARPVPSSTKAEDIRVDCEITLTGGDDARHLPGQVLFVSSQGKKAVIAYKPEPGHASDEERLKGRMERMLSVKCTFREGSRLMKKTRTLAIVVTLNREDVIRRVPAALGSILGLSPRK